MNHFASTEQLWQLPGPPASAPPPSHVTTTTYSPSTYGLTPGAQPDVVPSHNAALPGRRSSNSTWEDDSRHGQINASAPVAKPPLPVSGPVDPATRMEAGVKWLIEFVAAA